MRWRAGCAFSGPKRLEGETVPAATWEGMGPEVLVKGPAHRLRGRADIVGITGDGMLIARD